ncbi:acyl-CoA dehydrogenase family protein [Streptomyces kronopolitis]|uniref:acyl-CoA dehydrogenase family protein n=1 Tax=Streptomyces kronopolitis TaxID=1612435 RepID=UPI003D95E691
MDLTSTTLLSAAREVASLAARAAPTAEAGRRLDPDVVKAFVAAGFPRHFVPAGCGGSEGTFLELNRAVSAVGEGCTATAWCASLAAHVSRMAAHLPAEGCREIWADGPDALLVASLTPLGKAERVPGGYRLSGTYPFVSAIDHADWALLAGMVATDGEPEPRIFAVPQTAWRTADTWRNVGMAATGSNTVTVEDVTVPAARTVSRDALFTGRAVDSKALCHTVPMQATTMMFATPALGAAKGALASWLGYVTPKIRAAVGQAKPALAGMPTFNRTSYDVALARSATEIDAAELLLERCATTADRGPGITTEQTMRIWRDCAMATDILVGVVNRLFRNIGTTGQSSDNPVQRFWRDANSVAGHQGLQVESAATAYSHQVIQL